MRKSCFLSFNFKSNLRKKGKKVSRDSIFLFDRTKLFLNANEWRKQFDLLFGKMSTTDCCKNYIKFGFIGILYLFQLFADKFLFP